MQQCSNKAPGRCGESLCDLCRKQCLAPHSSVWGPEFSRRCSFFYLVLLRKIKLPPHNPTPIQGQFYKTPKTTPAGPFLPIFPFTGKKSDKGKSSQLNSYPQRSFVLLSCYAVGVPRGQSWIPLLHRHPSTCLVLAAYSLKSQPRASPFSSISTGPDGACCKEGCYEHQMRCP